MKYTCRYDTAVASQLAVYEFTLKTKQRDPTPTIAPILLHSDPDNRVNWRTGTIYAEAQNWARTVRLIVILLLYMRQSFSVAHGIAGEHAYANCAFF